VHKVRAGLDAYRFNEAAHHLYQFVWHEFCDWYVEFTKVDLAGGSPSAGEAHGKTAEDADRVRFYLHRVMGVLLKLLHPFAPFVSDELWSHLPGASGSLTRAAFPKAEEWARDPRAEEETAPVLQFITAVRNIRGEFNVPPSERLSVRVVCPEEPRAASLRALGPYARVLARLSDLEVLGAGERPAQSAVSVVGSMEIFVRLGGILNFQEEMRRLEKARTKLANELEKIDKKLAGSQFVERAPREIVEKETQRRNALIEEDRRLARNQQQIREIAGADRL